MANDRKSADNNGSSGNSDNGCDNDRGRVVVVGNRAWWQLINYWKEISIELNLVTQVKLLTYDNNPIWAI